MADRPPADAAVTAPTAPPLWYRPTDWSYLTKRRAKIVLAVLLVVAAIWFVYVLSGNLWQWMKPDGRFRYSLGPVAGAGVYSYKCEVSGDLYVGKLLRGPDGDTSFTGMVAHEDPNVPSLVNDDSFQFSLRPSFRWKFGISTTGVGDNSVIATEAVCPEDRWTNLMAGDEIVLANITGRDGVVRQLILVADSEEQSRERARRRDRGKST